MSKITKTLDRVLRGNADANIRFADLCALLTHLKFTERSAGDHHIFAREGVAEILNLQPRSGKAKAYRFKQVRGVLTAYHLAGSAETEQPATGETTDADPDPVNAEENDGE